ncbi:hypothetical protein OG792_07305 [Micromonospora sp. NBC_01699]|uniref:hypothetical protein n=1 Tax=Micromonospora sp. NBC_01699 TaxID=2975984 RepID=UPI002E36D3E4|nr:hypothetical protein [Micromonospora sp. NBC_01699]
MWDGRLIRRPIGRLVVAVLLTLLALTAVHGASSADTPAGALATPHASIGAALHHPHSVHGRAEAEAGSGRSADRVAAGSELRPPAPELVALPVRAIAPAAVPVADSAPIPGPRAEPRTRPGSGPSSRAPPA